MSVIEICKQLVSTDSSPDQGTLEIALVLQRLARQAGLHTRVLESQTGQVSEANILISNKPEGLAGGPVLFQSHMDTVPAGHYAHWTLTDQNPFHYSIQGDRAIGLGIVDAKADLAAKFSALSESKLDSPVTLLGTFGGSRFELDGVRLFLAQHAKNIKTALVGCPSSLRVVEAMYGATVIDIELPLSTAEALLRKKHLSDEITSTHSKVFRGAAAHSATPEKGQNAIIKLMEYLEKLPEGVGIVNVEGGVADNVVPEEAFLEFDLEAPADSQIRASMLDCLRVMQEVERSRQTIPERDRPIWNLGLLRHENDCLKLSVSLRFSSRGPFRKIGEWSDLLQKLAQRWNGTVTERQRFAPFVTRQHGQLAKVCQDVLRDLSFDSTPLALAEMNEATVFASFGVECLPIGPGQSEGNAHRPNESILQEDIERAARFYTDIMKRLAQT